MPNSIQVFLYIALALFSVCAGYLIYSALINLSAKIVTVFIVLIILSNCLAKIFYLLHQPK